MKIQGEIVGTSIRILPLTGEMFEKIVSEGKYHWIRSEGKWPTPTIDAIIRKDIAVYKKYPELLKWSVWLIVNQDGKIVGDIGFKGPPDGRGWVEIGYQVLPECQSQGYGNEAIGLICGYAADAGVICIEAEIHTDNRISRHLIEKNGFSFVSQSGSYNYFEKKLSQD